MTLSIVFCDSEAFKNFWGVFEAELKSKAGIPGSKPTFES
jgi:hypothetical protein